MFEVGKTDVFARWLKALKEVRAQARIFMPINRLEAGLLGDVKFFNGIGELRIDYGPGYRVYFVQRGNEIVILPCGGDKSTQSKDIKQAIDMAREL